MKETELFFGARMEEKDEVYEVRQKEIDQVYGAKLKDKDSRKQIKYLKQTEGNIFLMELDVENRFII